MRLHQWANAHLIADRTDTAGRLNSVVTTIAGSGKVRTVGYKLDASGNRTQLKWPDGYLVNYTFDSLDRMSTATDSNGTTLGTYGYDTFSRRLSVTYGNGASMSYSYTPAGDLQTLGNAMAGTANDVQYTLGYTTAHELNSETTSLGAYLWQPGTANATDTYRPVNKLNQYPKVVFSGQSPMPLGYDATGNLTSGGGWTYTYDPENRLLTAGSAGTTAGYAYDPRGRRVMKNSNRTTTYFLDDGDDEIAEIDGGTNSILRYYVPGPSIDEPIAMVPVSGSDEYFHTDHHGSVVAMSDANENLVEGPFLYDPYGNTTCSANCSGAITYKFTGQRLDPETGLYYYRARYYSPSLGRFLQVDPVGYTADMDLYTYVGNDPVDMTDPTGMYDCSGSASDCSTINTFVSAIGKAASKLDPNSDAGQKVNAVVKFLGKAGDKNGVTINATTVKGSAVALAGANNTINVDVAKANNITKNGLASTNQNVSAAGLRVRLQLRTKQGTKLMPNTSDHLLQNPKSSVLK
ncbi:MAG TPA: RHS repeat-associated core domain-containing protein [Rhizomicrobium sp.]